MHDILVWMDAYSTMRRVLGLCATELVLQHGPPKRMPTRLLRLLASLATFWSDPCMAIAAPPFADLSVQGFPATGGKMPNNPILES